MFTRYFYSGILVAFVGFVSLVASVYARTMATAPSREIVFIDMAVADYAVLAAAVRPGVEMVLLDPARDELAQMAKWAETHSGYEAIHLISHGSAGALHLGASTLTDVSLTSGSSRTALATLGRALNAGGDLMLYGCDVALGRIGEQFIADLAVAIGADVVASDSATGSVTRGGNWTLKEKVESIEAIISSCEYRGNPTS